ncbi:MAG: hypothetical protein IBX55_00650 [Methyloprofundus sp.]|nr:hypothetical protein [Methyloprofundus sp.]
MREVCEEIGETVVNNGIVSDTNESYEGSLVSVICECNSCEHAWTPRHKETNKKAIMIDDFSEYFSAQEVEELRGEL